VSLSVQGGTAVVTFTFDPLIAQLGPLQLGWHGLFTALAVIAALSLALRLAERRGLPTDRVADVAMWAVGGGIVGARLFHVLDHLDYFTVHPFEVVAVWQGGIAVYGAFIGGIAAGWFAARRLGLPRWRLLDLAAPAMLVGQSIGRLGCLANGDAWGAPCGSCPFCVCVAYAHQNDLVPEDLRGVPTHPYPVYEIVCEMLLLLLLWRFRDRLRAPGQLFTLAALGYAVIRFGLTFFRQERVLLAGLQEAQIVALATAVLVAAAYALWTPQGLGLRLRAL
jgi:phosphatidylglycerol:prolipoprotein diacylglycerol transferase